ncbi:substrate-binding domain-containing protein [Actibacterium sp. MT2.3-13A]|uniref:Bug family tripartite tricarboxylate transporter substrate binding protein n=1 Tax=Actibacterium sp. MT2.3-13A TaxID=2828332 RepID=UPI001BAB4D5B|nr:substrate-binding domain-containing protein [Actibacterium sp. MT2.3-13A]
MRRQFLKGLAAVAAMGLTGLPAMAQDAQQFYAGKAIKWIVPYKPGGGYDEYSRLLAPYMEKYTGARIEIVNVPGAGGMKGANEIFNAPDDGLTVGIINGSAMVTNQLAEIKGARYKVADYNFLGRVAADVRVLVTSPNNGFGSLEDIMSSDSPIVLGATGLGGSTYVDAVIIGDVFKLKQKVVHGFNSSSDVRQALLRGDIHGMWGSLGSALSGAANGDHRIILQSGRGEIPGVGNVPSLFDYIEKAENKELAAEIMTAWDALNAVGRPVAAPPGIPEDRVAFLRDAFQKSMNDPDFLAKANSAERELSFADGATMATVAAQATQMSPEVEKLMIAAIRGEL